MIRLRDLEEGDRDQLLAWRNHPDVARYMYTDHAISPEEHARWFERARTSDASRYWIIVVDGTDVGLASVNDIDRANSRCVWAYYLAGVDLRGRGVGSWVEYHVLEYVFGTLGLNKLCGEVLSFNEGVRALHRSFGFREEGILREQRWKNGEPHDVVCVGILRREWEELREGVAERLRAKGIPL